MEDSILLGMYFHDQSSYHYYIIQAMNSIAELVMALSALPSVPLRKLNSGLQKKILISKITVATLFKSSVLFNFIANKFVYIFPKLITSIYQLF